MRHSSLPTNWSRWAKTWIEARWTRLRQSPVFTKVFRTPSVSNVTKRISAKRSSTVPGNDNVLFLEAMLWLIEGTPVPPHVRAELCEGVAWQREKETVERQLYRNQNGEGKSDA